MLPADKIELCPNGVSLSKTVVVIFTPSRPGLFQDSGGALPPNDGRVTAKLIHGCARDSGGYRREAITKSASKFAAAAAESKNEVD